MEVTNLLARITLAFLAAAVVTQASAAPEAVVVTGFVRPPACKIESDKSKIAFVPVGAGDMSTLPGGWAAFGTKHSLNITVNCGSNTAVVVRSVDVVSSDIWTGVLTSPLGVKATFALTDEMGVLRGGYLLTPLKPSAVPPVSLPLAAVWGVSTDVGTGSGEIATGNFYMKPGTYIGITSATSPQTVIRAKVATIPFELSSYIYNTTAPITAINLSGGVSFELFVL